jgi:hypothetical protein
MSDLPLVGESGFPDQPHVDRIRDALWRRAPEAGKAAVLVGAGMSFNARALDSGNAHPPAWRALTKGLLDHLYPTGTPQRDRARCRAGATSGYLRLAQEYCVTFGRQALEQRIAEAVFDERFEPGELHELLLQLPWADVLTTNWDTLLERTLPKVTERTYDVIETVAEIHRAGRPRLVKLHGSLPNHSPLIVTEDDFRRYPTDFAPFVNLAQQVLMENVLCLIGFSGDDPNFLFWTGWVRDHLGEWAPPIYLAGFLGLSSPQRRLLESRNVIPIDLSHLRFRASASDEIRRREALHWLLLNLRLGEPYPAADWPRLRPRIAAVPDGLPFSSLAAVWPAGPTPEPLPPHPDSQGPTDQSLHSLRELVAAWRDQRRYFPGWIIAPCHACDQIRPVLEYRLHVLVEGLDQAAPLEALLILRELVWRSAIALTPLDPAIVERIDTALAANDHLLQAKTETPTSVPPPDFTRADLRSAWLEVAVERLRYARECNDPHQFNTWRDRLTPHLQDEPDLAARVCYERCLEALGRLDLQFVETIARSWRTENLDPFWTIRKAGLLAELGLTDEAHDTGQAGLAEIRRLARRDQPDIASLSREAWALFFLELFALLRYRRRRLAAGLPEIPSAQEFTPALPAAARVPDLTEDDLARRLDAQRARFSVYRCYAPDEFARISSTIAGPVPPTQPATATSWNFDQETRAVHYFGSPGTSLLKALVPAQRASRLVEEAGLPTVADFRQVSGGLLIQAAAWMLRDDPAAARALLLRADSPPLSEVFEAAFSRSRIALLTTDDISRLLRWSREAVDRGNRILTELGMRDLDRRLTWERKTGVALELVSRLALRLEEKAARELLAWALTLTPSRALRRPILTESVPQLLSRVLDALGSHLTAADALAILSLPLSGLDEAESGASSSFPHFLLQNRTPAAPPHAALPEIRALVQRLLAAAVQDSPSVRAEALGRLHFLDRWAWLMADELRAFGEAIWRPPLDQDRLPAGTGMQAAIFGRLPEPQPGKAEATFRALFLTPGGRRFEEPLSVDFLRSLHHAVVASRSRPGWLRLSPEDASLVARKMLSWWQAGHPEAPAGPWDVPFLQQQDLLTFLVITLADAVLPALPAVPAPTAGSAQQVSADPPPDALMAEQLLLMVLQLQEQNQPVEITFPQLVRLLPQHAADLIGRLRQSLASAEERPAKASVHAVARWWNEARAGRLQPPPEDLLLELALIVRGRRPSNLLAALEATAWIVSGRTLPEIAPFPEPFPLQLSDSFLDLLVLGLDYLAGTAVYSAVASLGGLEAQRVSYDIVEQRKHCVALARALAAHGRADAPSVRRRIEEAAGDPLPDVRMA